VGAILMLLYFLIEGIVGASPGKMILGIKVGTADGKQGNIALYLKRWGIKNAPNLLGLLAAILGMVGVSDPGGIIGILSQIIALVLLIGAFWIFGASKQCLWDKLAGTAIYKRSDLTAA
ncbi:MAG: RDD family protein, partial [bacterium]